MKHVTRRGWLTGSAAMGLVSAARAASRPADPPLGGLASWMRLASVPGASWATFDATGPVEARAEGFARAESIMATPETLFEAASLSKVVLAVAVHSLVRDGRLHLDRPVADLLDFTPDRGTRAITPRYLLSHSSGLPNWRDGAGEALVSAFPPGSRFRYSGEGFVLLGRLVEAVTGRTAAAAVAEKVLRPAGMTRSTYGWPRGPAPAVAWPHDGSGAVLPEEGPAAFQRRRDAGPDRPVEQWTEAERVAAAVAFGKPALPMFMTPNLAAGLWTTAGDYARFLRFAGRFPELSMTTTRVRKSLSWGLGWGLEQAGGRRIAWHWGSNSGVANLFAVDLSAGRGIVVLTNGAGGAKVYGRAARAFFGREFDFLTWL